MMNQNPKTQISRRTLLRSGGAAMATGVVLAACGGSTGNQVTRIGEPVPPTPLPEAEVTDVVLLRTAQSVEKMVASILGDSRVASVATGEVATVIAAFAAAHERHVTEIAPLVTARGATAVNTVNEKLMTSYGDTVLSLIEESKDPEDAATILLGMETLMAATYQYAVSLTTEPALRAQMMQLGAASSRRAAVAAQLINPGTKGFAPGVDANGNATVATLPSAFGPLNSVQIAIGPKNDVGVRTTVLMDTPSLNSLLYIS